MVAASEPEVAPESAAASGPEREDELEAHGEPEGEEVSVAVSVPDGDQEVASSSEAEGEDESSYSGSDDNGNVRRNVLLNPEAAYELLRNHPLKPFYRLQSWSKAKVEQARVGDRTALVTFLRELSGYPNCFDRNNRRFTSCECFVTLDEAFFDSLADILGECLFCLTLSTSCYFLFLSLYFLQLSLPCNLSQFVRRR